MMVTTAMARNQGKNRSGMLDKALEKTDEDIEKAIGNEEKGLAAAKGG